MLPSQIVLESPVPALSTDRSKIYGSPTVSPSIVALVVSPVMLQIEDVCVMVAEVIAVTADVLIFLSEPLAIYPVRS